MRSARGSYGSDLVIPVEHKCHHQFRTGFTIFSRAIKEFACEKSCFRFALLRSYNTLFNRVCASPHVTRVERVSSTCFARSKSNVSIRRFAALSILYCGARLRLLRDCVAFALHLRCRFTDTLYSHSHDLRVCMFVSVGQVKFNALPSDASGWLVASAIDRSVLCASCRALCPCCRLPE
ncbi:MAG: FIG00460457: hypothetical protein [uncultured Paraburkholderia sp.]|nr:MAG: FIG00460457: hypothetical protein [uncultured Paraburkholderia sp.]CAH2940107.1 MAG: FIG00460457: hypothetical protein [uncultured Paraburkholderia sp.]